MNNKNCRKCKYFKVENFVDIIALDCPNKYQRARELNKINKAPFNTTKIYPIKFRFQQRETAFEILPDNCEYYEDSGIFDKKYYVDDNSQAPKMNQQVQQQSRMEQLEEQLRQQQEAMKQQQELINKLLQEKDK